MLPKFNSKTLNQVKPENLLRLAKFIGITVRDDCVCESCNIQLIQAVIRKDRIYFDTFYKNNYNHYDIRLNRVSFDFQKKEITINDEFLTSFKDIIFNNLGEMLFKTKTILAFYEKIILFTTIYYCINFLQF